MIKQWIAVGALAACSLANAFAPQSGTWVVTSELNGKPGRGLAIDVQDKILVMQMYAYDASGNATFYLTNGALINNQYTGTLNKYRGGRYLGSGDRSGQDNGNDGTVSIRFESGTKGYISFPGEAEKEISRFKFAYSTSPESLKSLWLFTPLNSLTPQSDLVDLTDVSAPSQYGTGMVSTTDGRFGCENIVSGPNAGAVICVKLTAAGQLARVYMFKYSVNDGEGASGPNTTTVNELLIVRRLTDSSDMGTGILLKDTEVKTPLNLSILRDALEQASRTPIVQ